MQFGLGLVTGAALNTGQARSRRLRLAMLASSALLANVSAAAHADSLPTGGAVAAGSATIASSGNATTVTQASRNAVINWQGFSVGQGNAVNFQTPDATGATLNRVTGSAASTIAGQITSNGAVYLVNPNGIAITATGAVQTGGGFVASTLDISDADFMAGKLAFAGKGASKTVSNAGSIAAGQGAFVALLGGAVSNSGTISVPLGKVALGSGEQVALDLNGGNFMQVAVPTSLVTGAGALVDNSGAIVVNGGRVQLQAAVVKDAVRNVINMSGSISADSATGDGGTIHLVGGSDTASMAGTVTVTGSLSARATGASGNGGLVETSGEKVQLAGASVSTTAANGQTGTWLIDPTDFTVAAQNGDMTGAQLTGFLSQTSVRILSSGGTTGTAGNININDAVSWSKNTLTLDAANAINVNAVMSATGTAGFVGITGDTAQTGTGAASATANLLMGLGQNGFYGRLDLAPTASFKLNGTAYTIITTLGAAGSTTGTDLQGINGNRSGNYVLGADIDATATSGWNGGPGFTPICDGSLALLGNLNGLGHVISNLTEVRSTSTLLSGLIGGTFGSVSNIGMAGGSVSAGSDTGSLVGVLDTGGSVLRAWSSSTVTGGTFTGGLVGRSFGSISQSFATGTVTGIDRFIDTGGLVGANDGSISQSYATGSVNGYSEAGGLAGTNIGTIADSYATGSVVERHGDGAGGLVGVNRFSGSIAQSWSSGSVKSSANANGLAGVNQSQATITNSYWDSTTSGQAAGSAGGTITNLNAVTSSSAFTPSSYANLTDAPWIITNGLRPVLAWQAVPVANGFGLVSDALQLQLINASSASLSASYQQTRNIDLSATAATNAAGLWSTAGFVPLGTDGAGGTLNGGAGFIGSLTGAGFTIANLTINRPSASYVGLFGLATGAALSNLALVGGSVSGRFYVGDLVGSGNGGSITNASANGTVTASGGNAGGLAGQFTGLITGASAAGNVSNSGYYTGGLVGLATGQISNSYATGNVTQTSTGFYTGGLVGAQNGGGITNSYATGTVSSGVNFVGGLVGSNVGSISKTYATGAVSGQNNVGGLVGENKGQLSQSYATGKPTGAFNIGGVVGVNQGSGTVSNDYWDSYSSGTSTGIGINVASSGAITRLLSVTSDPTQSAAANYAFKASAWSNLGTIDTIGGQTATWRMYEGFTTPLLKTFLTAATISGALADATVKYNGSSQIDAVGSTNYGLTVAGGGGNPARVKGKAVLTCSGGDAGCTNVNTYTVSLGGLYSGQQGYDLTFGPGTSAKLTINPSTVTITGLTGLTGVDKVYDGTTAATLDTSKAMFTGLQGNDVLSVASYTADFVTFHAGSNIGITVSALTLGGASASNYVLSPTFTTNTITANITPRPLTITTPTIGGTLTKTYDGTTAATGAKLVGGSVSGALQGDSLSLDTSGVTLAYNSAHVADAASIGASGSLAFSIGSSTVGSMASDYSVTPPTIASVSASITPQALTATAPTIGGTLTKTYDGTTAAKGATLSGGSVGGALTGDSLSLDTSGVTLAYNSAHVADATSIGASGSLAFSIGASSFGSNASDYSLTLPTIASVSASIAPLALMATAPTIGGKTSKTYDGTTAATGATLSGGSVSGALMGDSLSLDTSGVTLAFDSAHVATASSIVASGKLTVAIGTSSFGSKASDYSLALPAIAAVSASITPATLTATLSSTGATKVYDGTTALPAGYKPVFTVTGLAPGDTAVVIGYTGGGFSSSQANVANTLTLTGLSLTGITGSLGTLVSDYGFAATTASVLTAISPRPITVTYTAKPISIVYGTTPPAVTGTAAITSGSLVGSDKLTGTATFSTTATSATGVGAYAINGSGLMASSNYAVTSLQANGNATALTITPRTLTVLYIARPTVITAGTTPTGLTGIAVVTSGTLVNGDKLAGTPTFTTSATSASLPGFYAIMGSGLSAGANYTISAAQALANNVALIVQPPIVVPKLKPLN